MIMKNYYYLSIVIFMAISGRAQLVPCRPKVCMVNYEYHNDNQPNANKDAVLAFKPDILIDNTPGGYWGQQNAGTGCIPSYYTPYGIKVFSYIAGGWEHTVSPSNINDLNLNLARVDAIANDAATGVFLDEVSHHPTESQKNYISAIQSRCNMHGLKLILNPGTTSFDPWLMDHCDYLMSDENYTGSRQLTASEAPFADKILVVHEDITSAAEAATITLGAHANGFGYSYACLKYIYVPSWLAEYNALISDPTTIHPVITLQSNGSLVSSFLNGNQWYGPIGPISGANGKVFAPTAPGTYYSIVSYGNGCFTGASNSIEVATAGQAEMTGYNYTFYPNPAKDRITFKGLSFGTEVQVYDIQGKKLLHTTLKSDLSIDVQSLQDGIYLLRVDTGISSGSSKFIKSY